MANEVKIKINADTTDLVSGTEKVKRAIGSIPPALAKSTALSKKEASAFADAIRQAEPQFKAVSKTAAVAFESITKDAEKASKETKGFFDDGFLSVFKGATLANLATSAFGAVTGAIKSFISGAVQEFEEGERAQLKLAQALKATGSFSVGTAENISAYAKQLEIVTGVSDKLIQGQVAYAKSLGATTTQSKDLVSAAANLSATFGGSLEENVKKLGVTLTGQSGKLAQLIPELKGLSAEQLKSGEAAVLINQKFANAAENSITAQRKLSNEITQSYGDIQGALGQLIVESTAYQKILGSVNNVLGSLSFALEKSKQSADRQKEGFIETGETVNFLSKQYQKLNEEIEQGEARLAQSRKLIGGDTATQEKIIERKKAELAALENQINNAAKNVKPDDVIEGPGKASEVVDPEIVRQNIEERKRILTEFEAFQITQAATNAEREILEREAQGVLNEADLEQLIGIEQAKIDAKYLVREQEIAKIEDLESRKLSAELTAAQKAEELEKFAYERRSKNKKAADAASIELERKKQAAILGIVGSGLQLASVLAKDGSREQFLIQKAAAIPQIITSTQVAMAQALAVPPAPNVGLAAFAKAQGAISLAAVAAQTIKGFNSGGLVSDGNIFGDSTVAALTKGEIVAPRKDFDDVIEGTARQRGFVKREEVEQQGSGESVVVQIMGDFFGEETMIDKLAEKFREAQRTRNVRLT